VMRFLDPDRLARDYARLYQSVAATTPAPS